MQLPDFLAQIAAPTPCRDNPDMWTDGASRDDRERAAAHCRTCPVITTCAQWALPRAEELGIWGGTNEADRRYWRRYGRLPRRPLVGCGTEKQMRRHRDAGEDCAKCRTVLTARVSAAEGHGTGTLYRLELLLGVPRCAACAEWCRLNNAAARARAAARAALAGEVAPEVGELPTGRQKGVQPFGKAA